MNDWKFDVSGMTPAQLKYVINALVTQADRRRMNPSSYAIDYEEVDLLERAAMKLRRLLPDHQPLPPGTIG